VENSSRLVPDRQRQTNTSSAVSDRVIGGGSA
jgi:hypothetical protein